MQNAMSETMHKSKKKKLYCKYSELFYVFFSDIQDQTAIETRVYKKQKKNEDQLILNVWKQCLN